MYKVLIVDDEFLARKLLQGYIETMPELEIVGSCSNAFEASEVLNTQEVDILLLDIHMPDLNGLDFARSLTNVPAIIFTTAYSEYALESYEVAAVDYLLKPFSLPRFTQAINKAKLYCTNKKDFMIVKADYKLYKVNYAELLYIEGQHEYVSFYTTSKRITALYSLKSLEELLPRDQFVRIHKSYIISIANIQEIEQLTVSLAGVKLPIGAKYRDNLIERLGMK